MAEDMERERVKSHDEAMDIIVRAASVSPPSYEEAVAIYLRVHGILNDGAEHAGAPIPDGWEPNRPSADGVAEELERLRRENMLLKADSGPMIMALLADADVYDPTDAQVEFANSVRRPDRSWNDEVNAIREHYNIPEPEVKPKKKRRAALKGGQS